MRLKLEVCIGRKARKVGGKANLTDGNTISAIPLSASLRGVQKEKEKNMSWKLFVRLFAVVFRVMISFL